ncbi:hypothetical protein BV25DRAFT_1920542 [Artomyces pyxidatus]|uniref:Uncharacterized protein n=1 Tax=Artomyces pyxidatus TaxID=48021 RepID=A0ACB8SKB3_9AGAM|nr:hypothetical protein BV25DRAFT_1920542 [Artomyces pyxidatus]
MLFNSHRHFRPPPEPIFECRPGFIPFESLLEPEERWRDRQLFLESRGYLLRPRYRPGWTPSWKTTGESILNVEDVIPSPAREHPIDATCLSDGRLVYIKRVVTGDLESTIATTLSSDALRRDPANHSVPILDHFDDPDKEGTSYIVMPFLRLMDDSEFNYVGEILDFGEQILEGLVFLHQQGVAHMDCSQKNLMMDATAMYPDGYHPVNDLLLPDISGYAPYLSRLSVGVRYYYVDFGISSLIPQGAPALVLGTLGRDQEVPELSDDVPYDPFKVDIFTIGNVFRREFYDKYSNVGFLKPFIECMTRRNPASRPTANKMLMKWRAMRQRTSVLRRHWRLAERREPYIWTAVVSLIHLVRIVIHLVKWIGGKRYNGSY